MGARESQILEVISEWGGEATLDRISRETGMSLDYVRLVCRGLSRGDVIFPKDSRLYKLKRKGKKQILKSSGLQPKKIVVSKSSLRGSYDKKGHFLLSY